MAIIIPSAKTYERQNPKVRDNVIERVEVGAKEVVPDNEYDTPVYNEDVFGKGNVVIGETQKNETHDYTTYLRIYSVCEIIPSYYNITIQIPKLSNNRFIKKIFYGVDSKEIVNDEGETIIEETPQIKFSLGGTVYSEKDTIISSPNENDGRYDFTITHSQPTYSLSHIGSISEKRKWEYTYNTNSGHMSQKSSVSFNDFQETIKRPTLTENENYYILSFQFLFQYEALMFGGYYEYETTDPSNLGTPTYKEYKSASEKTVVDKIDVTINGNTIGIDLKDKTLYIPDTDKTSKKVFSVDGNEILQNVIQHKTDYVYSPIDENKYTYEFRDDENLYATFRFEEALWGERVRIKYWSDSRVVFDLATASANTTIYNGGYHIDEIIGVDLVEGGEMYDTPYDFYSIILDHYKKGKETATIRCSISDYYDYVSNDKVIAIDNSTSKMTFDLYDQVIPMVYGADGKDRPMSTYQDGTAKVFQVLGTKIYYDGAVWQELSLQEV